MGCSVALLNFYLGFAVNLGCSASLLCFVRVEKDTKCCGAYFKVFHSHYLCHLYEFLVAKDTMVWFDFALRDF
jgi:hypothetical protein